MQRRSVLRAGLVWGGVAFLGRTRALAGRFAAQSCDGAPLGDLLETVPLHGDTARRTPFGELLGGEGLDGRRFTDLSKLDRDRLVTPTSEMFIRTLAPPALRPTPSTWPLPIEALRRQTKTMGAHLLECSGNVDPDNFGLMSVAEWDGVPLSEFLTTIPNRPGATAVKVTGFDDHPQMSRSSRPGASWVFPLKELERLGVFLAVGMNGETLTPDHGAPVRVVVPGWYGCSWIKWVNDVALVGADEPVTSQMIEFSLRTHQAGVPKLARDYEAPAIDLAAMPIRVEKRRVNGRLEYRIVGIVWGGDRPVDRLTIRFRAGDTPTEFSICPAPRTHRTWSLWDYRWRPTAPGVYNIALKAADPAIRTRRLDVSFYVRRVVIDEV
jgi:DMSO/TMAO reductase YedYZ molybdopterin-dependent catalytic subunit